MDINDLPESERKICLSNFKGWEHHRSGWKFAIGGLQPLSSVGGVRMEPYLDGIFCKNIKASIKTPFVGFFHNVPFHHREFMEARYVPENGLASILESEAWLASQPYCKGLFVVSPYLQRFLQENTSIPVNMVWHPTDFPKTKFSFDKFMEQTPKWMIQTGSWLRRFDTIFLVVTDQYHKCVLECAGTKRSVLSHLKTYVGGRRWQTVNRLSYVSDEAYDRLLSYSLVFLDLWDVAACNSVVDCIARNTPLLVRKMEGVVDYLGEDYPLYFENVYEVEEKMHDFDLIREASLYLKRLPLKKNMTIQSFREQVYESEVYQSLPEPSDKTSVSGGVKML